MRTTKSINVIVCDSCGDDDNGDGCYESCVVCRKDFCPNCEFEECTQHTVEDYHDTFIYHTCMGKREAPLVILLAKLKEVEETRQCLIRDIRNLRR